MKTTLPTALFLSLGLGLTACNLLEPSSTGSQESDGGGSSEGGGGNSGGSAGGTEPTPAQPTVPAQGAVQVRAIGRVAGEGNAMQLSWPGSAVEFTTRSASLKVNLTTVKNPVGFSAGAVAIFVDGIYQKKVVLAADGSPYSIPGLDGARHVVTIVKSSEPFAGDVQYGGVTGGSLEATTAAAPGRLIEFVGDSITAGFGVDGPQGNNRSCNETRMGGSDPSISNAAKAAPVLVAKALKADWSMVAYSGRGVYQNNDGKATLATLPKMYAFASPDRAMATPTNTPLANVVVVNLGTNDFYPLNAAPPQAAFVTAYANFLKAIRQRNPKAPIIAVVGPMLQNSQMTKDKLPLLSTATAYIKQAIAESGLSQVTFFSLATNFTDVSCDYHPDQAGQAAIAKQLQPAIQAAAGWN